MSRSRVLLVGAFPPAGSTIVGGIVTSCRALIDSTLPRRVDLCLVDSTQVSNPPPSLAVRVVLAVRRCMRFIWVFERCRPRAVLLFTSAGASLVEKSGMAWYSRARRTPCLMFPRGGQLLRQCDGSSLARIWVRVAFGGAQKVLCQGAAWQRFAINVLGRDVEDAPIVPNWTATERLLQIGRQRRVHRPAGEGTVRLLFLGWLEREKGIFELLDACGSLHMPGAFSLDIVGRGTAEASARRLVEDGPLGQCVHFRGWVQGEALEDVLRAADVLVLPSWDEGLPNAMIEAMAAGLAVIVSAVGNVPDFATNDRDALLVPPRDARALKAAIEQVIADPELRHRLSSAGHELAAREFSVEKSVDRLIEVLRSVGCDAMPPGPRGSSVVPAGNQ